MPSPYYADSANAQTDRRLIREAKARREATFPKCPCGNVIGLAGVAAGRKECSACYVEPNPPLPIEMTAVPKFHFALTKKQLDILIRMSETHYDGKCRAASQRGGYIYGWSVQMDHGIQIGEQPVLTASWHDVDLLCKIMENGGFDKEIQAQADALSASFHRAMKYAEKTIPHLKWDT